MKINPSTALRVNPSIFRAYDIRGRYPNEIKEEVAERLGFALAKFFRGKKTAVVGYDMRLSSKSLERALVSGLRKTGVNVVRLGMLSTPVINFGVIALKANFGVIVSASHNPKNYNAFKIIDARANQIGWKQGLGHIAALMRQARDAEARQKGRVKSTPILPRYIHFLLRRFRSSIRPLRIIVDYGNGIGGVSSEPVFQKLKVKRKSFFIKPDGRFPNHVPNPHDPKNFRWLKRELRRGRYDLGVFFDGDADRAVFFDHQGNFVRPDIVAGILALQVLKRHPKAEVYHDVRFSKAVLEELKKAGGKTIALPVGNTLYKQKIPERKRAWLGAELSGHIMFRDFWGIDDGLYAALKLMAIMTKTNKSLAELAKPFQRYAQSGEVTIKVKNPDAVLRKVRRHFRGGKVTLLDGLTVEYPDWWFNLRVSETEPVLRLNIEAKDPHVLQARKKRLQQLLQ